MHPGYAWSFTLRKTQTPALLIGTVDDRNLIVQRPEVIDVTHTKDTKRAQINDAADPLPHVKSVNPKETKESEKYPGDVVIDPAFSESQIRFTGHGWYQEQIQKPTNAQKTESKKINRAGDRLTIIKPV